MVDLDKLLGGHVTTRVPDDLDTDLGRLNGQHGLDDGSQPMTPLSFDFVTDGDLENIPPRP